MKELKFKPLNNTPVEIIYKAFNDAFSDYEVQEKTSGNDENQGSQCKILLGCFDKERLIGFILTGYRKIDGKKYAYDDGTGVVKDFQRKGIVKRVN